jgi:hypothetical protein
MARTKLSPALALKAFVETLKTTYPKQTTFSRKDVEAIGKSNAIGFTAFASNANGFGSTTRISQGQYAIPDAWSGEKAPWFGVTEPAPVASAPKAPKAPKAKKAEVPDTVEVVEEKRPVVKVSPKKQLTKKELFEKAKEEIAKKKAAKAAAASAAEVTE